MVVPLGIYAKAGSTLVFAANATNLPAGLIVYLEDKVTNTFTKIDTDTYSVKVENALNGVGQFYLHTTSRTLSIAAANSLENVSVYTSNNEILKIEGIRNGEAQVKLYSILGKKLVNVRFTANSNNSIALPKLKIGVYIIEVKDETGTLSKKLIIE
jgi:hypothetical protein